MTAVELTSPRGKTLPPPVRVPRERAAVWLRNLNHLSDALLHSRRRRAAQIQLRRLRPRTILFICHGNICRSPFAAAIFARSYPGDAGRRVTAASAGFIGPGRTPPSQALQAGLRHGVDISAHRSDVIATERLRAADLVVVMSADQAQTISARLRRGSARVLVLGDLDPVAVTQRTIADPWGGSDFVYDASYDRIERCVAELARIISEAR
jgi:protein-tyrosine-phosphatase